MALFPNDHSFATTLGTFHSPPKKLPTTLTSPLGASSPVPPESNTVLHPIRTARPVVWWPTISHRGPFRHCQIPCIYHHQVGKHQGKTVGTQPPSAKPNPLESPPPAEFRTPPSPHPPAIETITSSPLKTSTRRYSATTLPSISLQTFQSSRPPPPSPPSYSPSLISSLYSSSSATSNPPSVPTPICPITSQSRLSDVYFASDHTRLFQATACKVMVQLGRHPSLIHTFNVTLDIDAGT